MAIASDPHMGMAGRIARTDHPDTGENQVALKAAHIELLYSAPPFMLLNLLFAPTAALALWPVFPAWAVVSWIALIYLVILLRFLDRARYLRRSGEPNKARRWGLHFAIGAIATGCLWGLAATAMLLTADPGFHVIVFCLVTGLAATAALVQAAYMPAFVGFVIPAFLPLLVASFARQETTYIVVGTLLVAFVAVLAMVGYTINRFMADTLRLQIRQITLAGSLEAASIDLKRRDALLRAMVASAAELLRNFDLDRAMPTVLKQAGESTHVSRISVYQKTKDSNGEISATKRYEWSALKVPGGPDNSARNDIDFDPMGFAHWAEEMERGEVKAAVVAQLESPAREMFERYGVKSVLLVPVLAQDAWWGQLGFEDCVTERNWTVTEIDTLKTIAELIGAAIGHARDLGELSTAARIIEHSSTILYRLQADTKFTVTYISRNVARYGYKIDQFLSQPASFLDFIHPDDRLNVIRDLSRLARSQIGEIVVEYRLRQADGDYVWFENRIYGLYDHNFRVTAIEGLLIDINERKTAETKHTEFERTDQITGLANRKSFMELLSHAFAAARRGAAPFAILYLNLDHFKDINNALGHPKGDELLAAVADRLAKEGRGAGDVVARFGGDEFAVLQMDVPDPSVAGALATKILEALSEPYDLGTEVHATASIGVAVYDAQVTGPEELLKRANLALYRAKDAGRNQYHFHSEALDAAVRERLMLGEELRVAIIRKEMEMLYQPQVKLPSGTITGLEALIRWNHPTRGLVPPDRFISIAEKSGMIVPLGLWIVNDVCRQVAIWRAEYPSMPPVAINLSGAQLRPAAKFDEQFVAILRKHAIPASAIELELTESVLMQTTQENSEMIERLRALGAAIAIDDFGTGYSSMGYLSAFRVNRIKIAQEFIRDFVSDPGYAAIVHATINLARELGIQVIAEGVETAEQCDVLVKAGCDNIQGYYFSRPVSAAEAGRMLSKGWLEPASPDSGPKATITKSGADAPARGGDINERGDAA